jgi:hypothetical protein
MRPAKIKVPLKLLGTNASMHPASNPFNLLWSKAVLGCSILTVSGIWIYEATCRRVILIDQYAYPIMLMVFTGSLIALQVRPKTWRSLVNLNFFTLAMYLVVYAQALIYAPSSNYNCYDIGAFPQWFPLIYVTAFLFLRRKIAIQFSTVIYASIAIPFLISLLSNRVD